MSANMLGEALRTVCGPLGDLNQKLASPNGEEWLIALKRFLRKENPWDGKPDFPIFRTITLGTYRSVKDLRKALEDGGYCVSSWASDILGQRAFRLAKKETEVNLVKTTVRDLGFPEGATYEDICNKAKEAGLNLCPAEVGSALRYQYADQPRDEWLTVAMETIADADGGPRLFHVAHDDVGRRLYTFWSDPGRFWDADDQFVFTCK